MMALNSIKQSISAADVYVKLSEMSSALPDLLACYQLVLTMPVASASAERSFSTMRRIKSHLRASMTGNRLSNLSLTAVESEIIDKILINPDNMSDAFASTQTRRIDLIL